jgi:hypothetical protein
MSEPFGLSVYRRNGRFYVTADVLDRLTFFVLDDVQTVPGEPGALAAALAEAERIARKAQETPRSERNGGRTAFERPDDTDAYWARLGFKSWRQFVRGTTECSISREETCTSIGYNIRKGWALLGMTPSIDYPPDISYDEIARIVLDLFAKNPPPERGAEPRQRRT